MSVVSYEAVCTRCGDTFNPADEADLVHLERADGTECGGTGYLLGATLSNTTTNPRSDA